MKTNMHTERNLLARCIGQDVLFLSTVFIFLVCDAHAFSQEIIKPAANAKTTKQRDVDEPLIAPKPFNTATSAKVVSRQEILVFDLNNNGHLDLFEYKTIPSLFPNELRGKLPDPIVLLATKQFTKIKDQWNLLDINQDSKLDKDEFLQSAIQKLVPGLNHTEWKDWDRNHDGSIDLADCRMVLDIAYAIRHPSGVRLRSETGRVVNWYYFKYFDRNADNLITLEELEKYGYDGEKTQIRFTAADTDQNGKLTLAEWVTGSYRWIDPPATFLKIDTNSDGQIDQVELFASTSAWEHPVATHYFPGFDLDQNGSLSLMEYLDSPFAVPVVRWPVARQDKNNDGYLTLDEFRWETGLLQSALLAEYFHRLDLNQDGKLELNEFFFNTKKRSPKNDFYNYDKNKNKHLSEDEFLQLFNSEKKHIGKQQFRVFDLNQDAELSYSEFLTIPAVIPLDRRGDLLNPLKLRAEIQFTKIKGQWNLWDINQDSKLDKDEFLQSTIRQLIPGLSHTEWKDWDRNHDGSIDLADCCTVLDIAYAVQHPNGLQLRTNTGEFLSLLHFNYFDRNADNVISLGELEKYGYDGEKTQIRFKTADANKNGELTLVEWATGSYRWINPTNDFLRLDKNFDGRVDQTELLTSKSTWEHPIAKCYFPGFDLDNNGALSLMEYLDSPFAVPVVRWPVARQDKNNDGYLTLDEFRWESGLLQSALLAEYFHRLDLNQDGKLALNEFFFNTKKRTLETDFQKYDQDSDGFLAESEFLKLFNQQKQQSGKQSFRVFDLNNDGKLSFIEYQTVPSLVPIEQRGKLSHSTIEVMNTSIQKLLESLSTADTDRNSLVDRQEFQASTLARSVPILSMLTSQDWDRNQDGTITKDECQTLIEIAYGVRLSDGTRLRAESGLMVNWIYFNYLDKDQNSTVNFAELKKHGYDGDQATVRFQSADADKNGELTLTEWITASYRWIDPATLFLKIDQNFDGKIDEPELLANTTAWELPVTKHYFPGFDVNNDGSLSLLEFIDSPLANPIFRWPIPCQDLNNNGYLELSEFKWEEGIFASGVLKEYFQRFDVNNDGMLNLDEFSYRIHPYKAPRSIVFMSKDLDADGKLTFEELVGNIKPRADDTIDLQQEARLARMEAAFRKIDKDNDKKLSKAEFESESVLEILAPHLVKSKRNFSSSAVARSSSQETKDDYSLWIVLTLNILLLAGVAIFLIRKTDLLKSRSK